MNDQLPPLLLLVDQSAILYRAWYAIQQDMRTSSGQPTKAAYGYSMMLLNLLQQVQPAYVALASDAGAGSATFRHQLYPDYKAGRPTMPEEFLSQRPLVAAINAALGIPVYQANGVEADDIIATLAAQAQQAGLRMLIATGDKDLLQLVNDKITVALAGQKFSQPEYMNADAVKIKLGVPPEFVTSLKVLVGDPSDNIGGVPGIGPVRATKLLNAWGTIENIMVRLGELNWEKLVPVLDANRALIERNIKLVKLRRDLQHDYPDLLLDLDFCRFGQCNDREAIDLFKRLEFIKLYDRLNALLRRAATVRWEAQRQRDTILEGKIQEVDKRLEDVRRQMQMTEPEFTQAANGQLMMF